MIGGFPGKSARVQSALRAALGRACWCACASCFVVQVLCWLRGRHETSMRQGLYREHEQYRESRS